MIEPIPLENHPADSRVKISADGKCQALTSRMGTGGGNTPMILEPIIMGDNNSNATVLTDGKCPTLTAELGKQGGNNV